MTTALEKPVATAVLCSLQIPVMLLSDLLFICTYIILIQTQNQVTKLWLCFYFTRRAFCFIFSSLVGSPSSSPGFTLATPSSSGIAVLLLCCGFLFFLTFFPGDWKLRPLRCSVTQSGRGQQVWSGKGKQRARRHESTCSGCVAALEQQERGHFQNMLLNLTYFLKMKMNC